MEKDTGTSELIITVNKRRLRRDVFCMLWMPERRLKNVSRLLENRRNNFLNRTTFFPISKYKKN